MKRIRVGITMGDPSGIGPAITLKALDKLKGLADFTVIGDGRVLEKAGRSKKRGFKLIDLDNAAHRNFQFGRVRPEYGRASVEYLGRALELINNRQIDCLVTCPVSKEAINKAGISFSGHTEYLAKNTGTKVFVMMLLNECLKVSLVTRHIPLKTVTANITEGKLSQTIMLTYRALKDLFLISDPKIVVCGLNPHASDNGVLGKEENKIIKPAIRKLKASVKYLCGPKSADVAMMELKEKKYDCAVVMYHDQALIPLKVTSSLTGINITLGLPFIRTSPLHGTAFDIAACPRACNPVSLISAVRLAVQCASNQKRS